MNEKELYELQVKTIAGHPEVFGNLKPRRIRIVKKSDGYAA